MRTGGYKIIKKHGGRFGFYVSFLSIPSPAFATPAFFANGTQRIILASMQHAVFPYPLDAVLCRQSLAVAQRSCKNGNLPFGCLLADAEGNVLLEAENTVIYVR